MKKAIGFFGVAMLVASPAFAQQQPEQQRGTMSRAIETHIENGAKNPQSQGLPNSFDQLRKNSAKHEAHQADRGAARAERTERTERAERAERAERPERPERVERPERPERPEKVVRIDRPDLPGKGKNR